MYLFLHYFVSKREPYGIIYDLFTKYLMIIYTVFPVICLAINVGGVMASRVRLIVLCKVHSFRGSFSTPSHFAQNFKNWCFGVNFSRLFPAPIMPFNSRRDGRAPRRRGVAAPPLTLTGRATGPPPDYPNRLQPLRLSGKALRVSPSLARRPRLFPATAYTARLRSSPVEQTFNRTFIGYQRQRICHASTQPLFEP